MKQTDFHCFYVVLSSFIAHLNTFYLAIKRAWWQKFINRPVTEDNCHFNDIP